MSSKPHFETLPVRLYPHLKILKSCKFGFLRCEREVKTMHDQAWSEKMINTSQEKSQHNTDTESVGIPIALQRLVLGESNTRLTRPPCGLLVFFAQMRKRVTAGIPSNFLFAICNLWIVQLCRDLWLILGCMQMRYPLTSSALGDRGPQIKPKQSVAMRPWYESELSNCCVK